MKRWTFTAVKTDAYSPEEALADPRVIELGEQGWSIVEMIPDDMRGWGRLTIVMQRSTDNEGIR